MSWLVTRRAVSSKNIAVTTSLLCGILLVYSAGRKQTLTALQNIGKSYIFHIILHIWPSNSEMYEWRIWLICNGKYVCLYFKSLYHIWLNVWNTFRNTVAQICISFNNPNWWDELSCFLFFSIVGLRRCNSSTSLDIIDNKYITW